ncbi:MAG: hypothetical protein J6B04_03135 [Clostridia bacterium]|nr:hypothetical protein [Clostridia bacterium]
MDKKFTCCVYEDGKLEKVIKDNVLAVVTPNHLGLLGKANVLDMCMFAFSLKDAYEKYLKLLSERTKIPVYKIEKFIEETDGEMLELFSDIPGEGGVI